MADAIATLPTQQLDPFKGVKKVPLEEYFTSGHRTCQGCESALVMKLMVKASGPRTSVLGSTGCMYVAITAALTHTEYNFLILLYDNESYANTDIQPSGMTPYGAHTTFSPPGKAKRILHTRWKKNTAGMLAAGHPSCRYVATVCASYAVEMMNRVRKALTIGGPTFIHSLDPCPKGWDYDPMQSHELGELAVNCGIWPLYEVEDHRLMLYGRTKGIAEGRSKRKPVRDYLLRQGRFAHFTDDDIDYFQAKVDEMWERWIIPGVIPFASEIVNQKAPV